MIIIGTLILSACVEDNTNGNRETNYYLTIMNA